MPPQNPSDNQSPYQQTTPSAPRFGETPAQQLAGPGQASAPPAPVARRSVLRGVAAAGAVGAAAALGAGAGVEFDHGSDTQTTLKPLSKPVAVAPMAPSAMDGPLVVWIADPANGVLNVFGGTGATEVRNPALLNKLLANLELA